MGKDNCKGVEKISARSLENEPPQSEILQEAECSLNLNDNDVL